MPYRLRLFSALIATDHDTTQGVGHRAAEYPLDDLPEDMPDGTASGSVRRVVVFRDDDGMERPATPGEEDEGFAAISERMRVIAYEETPACPRCGLKARGQAQPSPVRITMEGPVCFGCWTHEEQQDLPPELRG
jgi:hypothetical protein